METKSKSTSPYLKRRNENEEQNDSLKSKEERRRIGRLRKN